MTKPNEIREMDMTPRPPPPGLQRHMDAMAMTLKLHRLEAGLSREELAERSGIPLDLIERIERAEHSPCHATRERLSMVIAESKPIFILRHIG